MFQPMTQRYLIRFYSATSCAETEVTMNRSIVRMFYGIFELPVDVMMYLRYLKTILVFIRLEEHSLAFWRTRKTSGNTPQQLMLNVFP